jgi:hypothetical protein
MAGRTLGCAESGFLQAMRRNKSGIVNAIPTGDFLGKLPTFRRSVTDVLEIIEGLKPKYGWLEKKGCDLIDKVLGDKISKVQQNSGALQTFTEIFFATTYELCSEKLKM